MKQADSVQSFEALLEEDFHKQADELTIVKASGTMHGVVDIPRTTLLRQCFAHNEDGSTNWQQTYKLRKTLQQGHYLAEQNKRDGL